MAISSDTRYEGELAELRGQLGHLRRRFARLSDLNRKIMSNLEVASVLKDIVDAACDLTGARYGAMAVFDEAGRVQTFVTHGMSDEDRERLGDPPKGLGLLGLLQHEQKPLRLADLSRHPSSVGFPPNHPAMKSFLGAPVRLGEQSFGNLYLTEKIGSDEFTLEDEDALVLFASQAALAIHNAQQFETLEDERRRLETLLHLSPVGVLMIEAGSRRIIMANREAERLLGSDYRAGRVLKDRDQILMADPDGSASGEEAPIQRALTRGETVRAEEVEHRFSDERSVPTLVSATPIRGEAGEIVAAVSIIQDISPLEELERLKGEFLGIVSHELRTPLTAIKGSAATVLGGEQPFDDREMREFFQIIDEQADRMRDLISNLLDMTRIEAGSLSVNLARFDLGEAIDEAKSTFATGGGYQEIRVDTPAALPTVQGDRRRIVQVLDNLLNNAGKFSPDTAPIAIAVEASAEEVTVHVSDEGRGIGPLSLPHVFKKFYQERGFSGSGLRSSGLGLAICKGIVEAHGGRIWATSPGEGRGSTFSFRLPIGAEGSDTRTPDVTRRSSHVGQVAKASARTKILVVDDEPQILRYVKIALARAGFRPIVTPEPAEVMELIELEQPQLVLLDLMFPTADGFELLVRIREASGVPVICLTARDGEGDIVNALKLGADDYVTKPFSPSELVARIEASLRRRVLVDQIEVRPPLEFEGLTIEFAARRVTVSGDEAKLTPTEYKLLYELATNAGRVLTYNQILQRVWGPEYDGESQLVRAMIRNLRRKLGDSARNPRLIFTVPQVGYRMDEPSIG